MNCSKNDCGFYIKDSEYSANVRFFQFINYSISLKKPVFIVEDDYDFYKNRYDMGIVSDFLNNLFFHFVMFRDDGILFSKSHSISMNHMISYAMYLVNKLISEYDIDFKLLESDYRINEYDIDVIYITSIINDYIYNDLGNVVTNHYGDIKIIRVDKGNKIVYLRMLGGCYSCAYKMSLMKNISRYLIQKTGYSINSLN